jgi:2-polyprenyl-6-methoxyphenol hydroxylase-like FAD-dependent oxidoreductase
MKESDNHAVVLGASLAGLLAARVLSDRYDRVTLVERDAFPALGQHRKGVPHGRHAHGLLAAGVRVFEEYFPGLSAELAARGACTGDLADIVWVIGGRRVRTDPTGLRSITFDRPLLEGLVRERVLANPRVRAIPECDALGLVHRGDRVTGVRVLRRRDGSADECLDAALVVDATGRGSRLPAWLAQLGFPAPREEHVRVRVGYATEIVRRSPDQFGGALAVLIGPAPPNRRAGVALAIDAERWMVTLVGYLGARAEPTHAGMREFSRALPSPELFALLSESRSESDVVAYNFPHSQRRRYEALARHPQGIVAAGDAICSFNPAFGQGMSVAALESRMLARWVARGRGPERFYADCARVIDVPWSVAVGTDLRFPEVEGPRPLGGRLLRRYLDRVVAAAAQDALVGETFLRVTNLIDPPSSLMSAAMLRRVLLGRRPRSTPPPLPTRAASPPG